MGFTTTSYPPSAPSVKLDERDVGLDVMMIFADG